MASQSETGHYVNIANFNTLLQYYNGFGSNYNPSNPDIQLPALQALHGTALAAHQAIEPIRQPYTTAVNVRQTEFAAMKKLSTRIFNAFKSSKDVSPLLVKDAKTILNRIRGVRTSKNVPESEEQISVSQQSYNMLYDHFAKFVAIVTAFPNYAPNETELQSTTISNTRDNLLNLNNTVIQVTVPLKDALSQRNKLLYSTDTGLVDLALASKAYVLSTSGPSSDSYRLIKGIRFSRPRKKI